MKDQRAYAWGMINITKIKSQQTFFEYFEEAAKIMASRQSNWLSYKTGIYYVHMDSMDCGLGFSQQYGLGFCPPSKKMKVLRSVSVQEM